MGIGHINLVYAVKLHALGYTLHHSPCRRYCGIIYYRSILIFYFIAFPLKKGGGYIANREKSDAALAFLHMLQRSRADIVIVSAGHALIRGNDYISSILMLVVLFLQEFMRNTGHIDENMLYCPACVPEISIRALIQPHSLSYTARAYKIHGPRKFYCAVDSF